MMQEMTIRELYERIRAMNGIIERYGANEANIGIRNLTQARLDEALQVAVCEHCGRQATPDNTVDLRVDPFKYEFKDEGEEIEEELMCDECKLARSAEI